MFQTARQGWGGGGFSASGVGRTGGGLVPICPFITLPPFSFEIIRWICFSLCIELARAKSRDSLDLITSTHDTLARGHDAIAPRGSRPAGPDCKRDESNGVRV